MYDRYFNWTGKKKMKKAEKGKIYFLSSIENHYLLSSAFFTKQASPFSLFKSISIYASIYLCTLGEGLLVYKKFYLKIGFYFFMTLYILGVPGQVCFLLLLPLFMQKSWKWHYYIIFPKTFIDLNSLYEFSLLPDILKMTLSPFLISINSML